MLAARIIHKTSAVVPYMPALAASYSLSGKASVRIILDADVKSPVRDMEAME